jgi:hypothetical protein
MVVAVDQIHEKSCVHHFEYPLWCGVLCFVVLIIARNSRTVNPIFEKK